MDLQPTAGTSIRPATIADAEALARIYNYYVQETIVTFEEEAVLAVDMAGRIDEVRSASLPWMVAEEAGEVAGYAYASKWKGRRAYRFSTEVTVYLEHGCGGRGIGTNLYSQMLPALKAQGFHVVIGGIALPNAASVVLHEKFGFEKAAQFQEVGFKFGKWIDVGYWHKIL